MATCVVKTSSVAAQAASLGFSAQLPAELTLVVGAILELPCELKTSLGGLVRFGRFSYINGRGRFTNVSIGRYCSIAEAVAVGYPEHPTNWLSSSALQYSRPRWATEGGSWAVREHATVRHTTIEDDVWLGAGAFIRAGITVGTGSIIGAHTVVTRDVPPYSVVVGNPGRIIRTRFPEKTIERLLAARWWNYSIQQLDGCPFGDIDAALGFVEDLRARGVVPAPVARLVVNPGDLALELDAAAENPAP